MKASIFKAWNNIAPISFLKFRYRYLLKRCLDLKNPQDLNEKIIWMALYSDTSEWSKLADKYVVREYVKKCGLEDILVKLYGVWDNVDDIDFDKLPNSYILKTNHGCGDIIPVSHKDNIDVSKIKTRLDISLKNKYSGSISEKHYDTIYPRIIAEELLVPTKEEMKISSSIIDYKFMCFNGIPHSVLVCSNRNGGQVELSLYDNKWTYLPEAIITSRHHLSPKSPIPKPSILEECYEIAKILAKPFPFVRVDLYIVNNKPYFGEMTFTPCGGIMPYFPHNVLLEMGRLVTLPPKK